MNILIVGGAGYIGSHVTLAALDKGCRVTVFDDLSTGFRNNVPDNVNFIHGSTLSKSDLKSVFEKDASITAGNASSLSDGAAAVCLASSDKVNDLNLKPIAKIIAHASFAMEPMYFTKAPIYAIKKALQKSKLNINDIDLFEINEAFSCVPLVAMDELNIPIDKLNINGGAVSLGHPIGASGARILVTLLNALKEKNMKYGLASLCIGGGEASALIVEMCN